MSWVAVGTTALGAVGGGGGGGLGGLLGGGGAEAPMGPAIGGDVKFGDFNVTPQAKAPAWLVPVIIGVFSVLTLGLLGFFLSRRSRR